MYIWVVEWRYADALSGYGLFGDWFSGSIFLDEEVEKRIKKGWSLAPNQKWDALVPEYGSEYAAKLLPPKSGAPLEFRLVEKYLHRG